MCRICAYARAGLSRLIGGRPRVERPCWGLGSKAECYSFLTGAVVHIVERSFELRNADAAGESKNDVLEVLEFGF